MTALRSAYCVWCGGGTSPTTGIYLSKLYPERRLCRPCGRLQIDCSCEVGASPAGFVAGDLDGKVPRRPLVTSRPDRIAA